MARIAYVSNRGLGSPGDIGPRHLGHQSRRDQRDSSPTSRETRSHRHIRPMETGSSTRRWEPIREIYVARSSGQDPVNITNAATNERAPDWKAAPNTNFAYPRPKGATPMRVPLVVAYPECTSPNRTHGPPLAFPSCAPPVPSSANVNVGNPLPDLSGAAANMMGSIRYDVMTGVPGPPDDSDARHRARRSSTCAVNLKQAPRVPVWLTEQPPAKRLDVGELQASVAIAITDRWNAAVPAERRRPCDQHRVRPGGHDPVPGDRLEHDRRTVLGQHESQHARAGRSPRRQARGLGARAGAGLRRGARRDGRERRRPRPVRRARRLRALAQARLQTRRLRARPAPGREPAPAAADRGAASTAPAIRRRLPSFSKLAAPPILAPRDLGEPASGSTATGC